MNSTKIDQITFGHEPLVNRLRACSGGSQGSGWRCCGEAAVTLSGLYVTLRNARNVLALALQNGAWDEESNDEQDSAEEVASVLADLDAALAKIDG